METIKLDLIPGKKMPSLHASQYDDGRDYHIDLTENRVPYTLDGTETISLTVRKCDNTLVTMDIANTFANKSYIEFRTTEQMNACAGFNYGEITIEKNGTQISSLNFYLQVEGAPDEGGITSQSEINNLARQVHDIVVEELEDHGAEDTGYDNTESGLEATNVQDAIDELANKTPEDIYTKEESDDKFATKTALQDVANDVSSKADANNVYTKQETYSKEEIDNNLPDIVREIAPDVVEDVAPPIVADLVSAQMSEVIGHGKNIINPDMLITSEGGVDANTGVVTTEGGSYKLYGYYELTAGQSYTISKSANALWLYQYYANGTYCGYANSITVGGGTSEKTFTAVGDKILLMSTKTVAEQQPQLELGSSATAYEPFHPALKSDVEVPIVGTGTLDTEATQVIPAVNEVNEKTDREGLTFERSYNLLDPMKIEAGSLGNAGGVSPSSTAFTTDFIEVEGSDIVRSSHECFVVCFYDTSKAFISGSRTTETKTATAPATAKYVRATYLLYPTSENASLRCLYISATEKVYEPYLKIKKAYLPTEVSPYPEVKMVMPRKLAVANNVDISVNFQSVIKGWDVNQAMMKSVFNGLFPVYDNKVVINGGSGNNSTKIQFLADYNLNYNIHELTLLNVPLNAGSGENKICLFIGDSKTDANIYTQMLLDMFDDDAMDITLIGTRGNSASNRHEGRSGWSARGYVTNEYERGVVDDSPFYNPNTHEFDFNYYMTQNGYSHVDYVFICLGTNDSESNFIGYYKDMIEGIKDYDSNIIIGVWTPAPFATFGGYSHRTNDAVNFPKIEDILTEFDNDTYEARGIYVVPTHINIDTFYDFPWTEVAYNDVSSAKYRKCTDQIHETYGYCHDADVIFSYIKYFATL